MRPALNGVCALGAGACHASWERAGWSRCTCRCGACSSSWPGSLVQRGAGPRQRDQFMLVTLLAAVTPERVPSSPRLSAAVMQRTWQQFPLGEDLPSSGWRRSLSSSPRASSRSCGTTAEQRARPRPPATRRRVPWSRPARAAAASPARFATARWVPMEQEASCCTACGEIVVDPTRHPPTARRTPCLLPPERPHRRVRAGRRSAPRRSSGRNAGELHPGRRRCRAQSFMPPPTQRLHVGGVVGRVPGHRLQGEPVASLVAHRGCARRGRRAGGRSGGQIAASPPDPTERRWRGVLWSSTAFHGSR